MELAEISRWMEKSEGTPEEGFEQYGSCGDSGFEFRVSCLLLEVFYINGKKGACIRG